MRKAVAIMLLGLAWLAAGVLPAAAQMAVENEAAGTGFFRDQDTLPGAYRLYLQQPKELGWLWAAGPQEPTLRKASFTRDAHAGLRDYSARRPCTDCHKEHTRDLHQSRAGITCVQCHRDRPVAGVHQYYAAMNPIRRHAYVCAKCHEGSTPSFAAYVIHEPNPLSTAAREAFPAAEKAGDEPTADLLTQRMQLHEKNAWMLRSMLA